MREVHYFQRFSKREDVVTNNTLLLLLRLQHHSILLFEQALRVLLGDDSLVVGAKLTQQESSPSRRIADGVIEQRSFKVVIETKLHTSFDLRQLKGHLTSFGAGSQELGVLLLLATSEPSNIRRIRSAVDSFNLRTGASVGLAWVSFAKLLATVRDVVPEHELALLEMVSDYESFCDGEGLLSLNDADCLVVGCSRSLVDNIDLGLYWDAKMSHRSAAYIGFYEQKAIRAVGLLDRVVYAERKKGKVRALDGSKLTADDRARIETAMDRARNYGWRIDEGHRFYFARHLQETAFRKRTKYPLRGRRYLDLRSALGLPESAPMPAINELAARLRTVSW